MNDKVIETATKAIAGATITLYVAGFIVTNLYLRLYGFSDFSILRTRYILTGATVVVFLAMVGGTLFLLWSMLWRVGWQLWQANRNGDPRVPSSVKATLGKMLVMAQTLFLPVSAYFVITGLDFSPNALSILGFMLTAIYAEFAFDQLQFLALSSRISPVARERAPIHFISPEVTDEDRALNQLQRDLTQFTWLTAPVIVLTAFMLFFATYARFVYSVLPEQIGGGRERIVQLVVREDYLSEATALGLRLEPEQLVTEPYPLIWESDTYYLIGYPSQEHIERAVQIDKTLIAGMTSHSLPAPGLFSLARRTSTPPGIATPAVSATPSAFGIASPTAP